MMKKCYVGWIFESKALFDEGLTLWQQQHNMCKPSIGGVVKSDLDWISPQIEVLTSFETRNYEDLNVDT